MNARHRASTTAIPDRRDCRATFWRFTYPIPVNESASAGHVFISYVREDRDQVDRVQRLLEAAGILVWRDTESLWPGEDWRIKIRQAITANSLAVVACFSQQSETKASTFQREELLLAIDQLRLRQPDRPWLIPVRFSDCSLPQYDLGGGRTLDSLQRVDLFGDGWELGSARLVSGVLRALPDRGTSDTPTQARPEAFVKSALLNPVRLIELEDFVMQHANSAAVTCADEALFPTTSPRLTDDNDGLRFLTAQVDRYWDAIDPLLQALIPGCAWGQPQHEAIWSRAVQRVANATPRLVGGQTALLELRRFPILPLLYGAGLAAVRSRNFAALRAVAVDATYHSEYGSVPLVGAAHVWRPFGHFQLTPQLLALESTGQELTDDLIDALRTRRRGGRHTPVSDYLHDHLRPYLRSLIPDDAEYTSVFDRLEVVLGAMAADEENQAKATRVYVDGPWFGSFIWRDRHGSPKIEEAMLAELRAQGERSPLLAGGLFGGHYDRAEAGFVALVEGANEERKALR